MKKTIVTLFALGLLTGCVHDGVPLQTDKICLDGVVYHKVLGSNKRMGPYVRMGIAVAYNTDGTIQTCEVQ